MKKVSSKNEPSAASQRPAEKPEPRPQRRTPLYSGFRYDPYQGSRQDPLVFEGIVGVDDYFTPIRATRSW